MSLIYAQHNPSIWDVHLNKANNKSFAKQSTPCMSHVPGLLLKLLLEAVLWVEAIHKGID